MEKCRVLFVEDNEDFRRLVIDFLEGKFRFKLVVARSGDEAIRLMSRDERFDIVITDYFMPNGTGKDVLDFMNRQRIETPTVLLSGGGYDHSIFHHPKSFQFVDKALLSSDLPKVLSRILKSILKE